MSEEEENFHINFGKKYRGTSVKHIFEIGDYSYLEYIINNSKNQSLVEISAKYLNKITIDENPERDIILNFGKYNGKTISEVFVEDKGYLRWFLEEEEKKKFRFANRKLYNSVKNLFEDSPLGSSVTSRIRDIISIKTFSKISEELELDNILQKQKRIKFSASFSALIRTFYENDKQICGIFFDYLIRRLICEINDMDFEDARARALVENNDITKDIMDGESKRFSDDFETSYEKVLNMQNKTRDIIYDVFIISTAHNIWFNDYNHDRNKNFMKNLNLFEKEYVEELKHKIFINPKILINPVLSTKLISGDADLIVGENLIDIKVSASENKEYLLQLLFYAALAKLKNHEITQISTFNILSSKITSYDISELGDDYFENILRYFKVCI